MTTEEAFVKVLQMHGIEHAFGIIGSAFMPISDIFPDAGITFWDVAHETNGGLIADGYTRSTGKMSMVIAQNGPGITGLVTPIKTAYWNHTPLLLVTPQAANNGNTSGPHVCYRFWKNGRQVDPLKQKLPEAKPISKELKKRYMVHMDPIKKQLDAIKSNVTFATKS